MKKRHAKVTSGILMDFNRGKMSKILTRKACHGISHTSENDLDKAKLLTIKMCKKCPPGQSAQYLIGKHALGRIAIERHVDHAHATQGLHGRSKGLWRIPYP